MLPAEGDHGHPAARVNAATYEEEVCAIAAALGRLEREVLAAIAYDAIDRAAI